MRTIESHSPRLEALLGLVLAGLILGAGVAMEHSAAAEGAPAEQASPPPAAAASAESLAGRETTALGLSPAEALATGRPTLFYFYPLEFCWIRYCRQPEDLAGELSARYGDRVNLVTVGVIAGKSSQAEAGGQPLYTNMDLYPIPQVFEWLPEAELTVYGMGIEAPQLALVGADGELLRRGDESMDLEGWAVEIE